MKREAWFTDDRAFRFLLTREWDPDRAKMGWLLMNPSIADEDRDDPTIRRCIGYACQWGFGGLYILNVHPRVGTDPDAVYRWILETGKPNGGLGQLESVGQQIAMSTVTSATDFIVAGWGSHKLTQTFEFASRLRAPQPIALWVLGENGDGNPVHPLYQKGDLFPRLWREAER